MGSKHTLGQVRTKAGSIAAIISSGVMAMAFSVAPVMASGATIYNNIPSPIPGNLPSQAFEATSTSEFGGQVAFTGSARQNPTVTVLMSSWGCESGTWNGKDCHTNNGSTFSEPVTLNVYSVGSSNAPGTKIASVTKTFNIPYRPSSSASCIGEQAGEWFDAASSSCFNGLATPINFDLSNVRLPNKAIVSVAYNTSDYGAQPWGDTTECHATPQGCGYDSLNVALTAPPTIGSDPLPNDAYINSTWSGAYCPSDTTTGTFRLDTGCWTGYQPAISVSALPISVSKPTPKATGDIWMSNPSQQINFSAFDAGPNSSGDKGSVEYWNYDYAGGLHYTAPVTCATITDNTARFMFQIPDGYPGLSGLYVVAAVTDGGTPGTNGDTYAHAATSDITTAQTWCENGVIATPYTIVSGNLVVH